MKKVLVSLVLGATTLGFAGVAQAAPPTLLSVGHQNRHVTATFSAPGADFVNISVSRKPDVATDGTFLNENVATSGYLTATEIASGAWLGASQIDPGFYYVQLQATDYDCSGDPACTDGFSDMTTLTVPKPRPSFRAAVGPVFRAGGLMYLKLTVRPLGERLSYRVCWRLESGKRKCANRAVTGYNWNSSAYGLFGIRMRGMADRTKFTWYVNGRAVAAKTVNTRH